MLIAFRNTIDIFILTLYHVFLLNLLINSGSLFENSLGFSKSTIMPFYRSVMFSSCFCCYCSWSISISSWIVSIAMSLNSLTFFLMYIIFCCCHGGISSLQLLYFTSRSSIWVFFISITLLFFMLKFLSNFLKIWNNQFHICDGVLLMLLFLELHKDALFISEEWKMDQKFC